MLGLKQLHFRLELSCDPPVVDLWDVTADGDTSASRAVVGALGCGIPALGPAQGPLGDCVQQGVLLQGAACTAHGWRVGLLKPDRCVHLP
jgi:hypothetical protein